MRKYDAVGKVMRTRQFGSTTRARSVLCVTLLWACGRTELQADPTAMTGRAGGSGGSQNIDVCPDGTFDDGTTGGCVGFRACSRGTYVSVYGTPTSDRKCAPCPAGSFSADSNQAICRSFNVCDPGEYVQKDGTATTNQECALCPSGSYSALANAATCTPWSDCEPGTWVTWVGSAARNRECAPCAPGTFSSEANAQGCTQWTCPDGFVQETPGTPTSDVTCTEEWIREFGTGDVEYTYAVDLDQEGNVYAAGFTGGVLPGQTGFGKHDAFIRKYDALGNELILHQFGSSENDYAAALVVDGASFFVAGATDGALPDQTSSGLRDAYLQKYDGDGNLLWTEQFGSSADDGLTSLTVDQAGNAHVAGLSSGSFFGEPTSQVPDGFLRTYYSDGGFSHYKFGATGAVTWPVVTADGVGNVYVAGTVEGELPGQAGFGSADGFLLRMDINGSVLWTRQFGSSAFEEISAVKADASGNVYVAGSVTGALPGQTSAGGYDAFLRKYNSSGVEQWTRQFGAAEFDDTWGLALDLYGTVIVSGTTFDQEGAGSFDVYVRRYDSTGSELAVRLLGSSETDSSLSLVADATGGVAVVGYTFGALPGQSYLGSGDAFVARLSL